MEEIVLKAERQHLIVTYARSLGVMTVFMSLLQLIPSASAQQLTGPVSRETSGTGTQGQRIESIAPTRPYPTKSLEKNDAQTSTRRPHRLIQKPQNAPIASVEPSPSGSSSVNSLPTPPPSLQSENATSQSKEPSSFNRSVGVAVPLATMSVAPSSATTTRSTAVGIASTGTIPLASAGAGNSSTSGSGGAGGRAMRKLAAEMPGLAQLNSPPSFPASTINLSPSSLSYAATEGAANPAIQNISLTNSGRTFNWTVSDDASWLTVSPASGSGSTILTTSVNMAGLTAGTYNGILTVNAAGTSSKTVAVALTVSAQATSSVTLTWNANTDSNLAGYKIYRATTSGGYGAPIATLQGNITTYIAAGLQSGTTYFFVITAYNSAGNESPRSNEISKSIF